MAVREPAEIHRLWEEDTRRVIGNDDLAIIISDWKLTYAGEDGAPVELGDTTTDVVRRQSDGAWLIAVDNPFGIA